MPEFGIRSTYSQCPFQIYLCDGDGIISTGTAFFFAEENETFFVTNWHNVSGKDSFDQTYLGNGQRTPLSIRAKFATWVGDSSKGEFTTVATDVPLYSEDRSTPVWFEHPELGHRCDVVGIPFPKPKVIPEFMHNSANKISDTRIPVKPGNAVFIIGFPQNLSVTFGLPIWKSGFIASEPHYDVTWGGKLSEIGGMSGGTSVPAFFVDALTRQGMSGSPVFASYTGNWDMKDPYRPLNPDESDFWNRNDVAIGESKMEFVGIYSGRIPSKEAEAALGFVWKESAIRQICVSKKIGTHPHM
jgi:hypothetical protein